MVVMKHRIIEVNEQRIFAFFIEFYNQDASGCGQTPRGDPVVMLVDDLV